MAYTYSREDAEQFQRHYKLFLDLDGVLADFDRRIMDIFGKLPHQIHPGYMWSTLAKTDGFYRHLPWIGEGKDLWNTLSVFGPVILTGVPRGKWAVAQKLDWCERELGSKTEVITCYTREKPEKAGELCPEGIIPVLIDDRDKILEAWEKMSGIFIHHKNVQDSLCRFDKIVQTAKAIPVSD